MISTLSVMALAEDDEYSVVIVGISVIALNVSMYVGVPIMGIVVGRKYLKR